MTPDPAHTFRYVDRQSTLDDLAARVRRSHRVAVDTEADSLHHYFEKLCLIQVSFEGRTYLVDPLVDVDLTALLAALATRPLILHSAENDLRLLRRFAGFVPQQEVFDTLIAAQLLGRERLGMAALVEARYGVRLPKGGQKSNWSRRPLTAAQLRYAALDVAYLEGLADTLRRALQASGRESWLAQSAARMVERTAADPTPAAPEAPWQIKGTSRFDRHQLAVVKRLWHWRDQEARQVDLPPFRILHNTALLELAEWVVAHPGVPPEQGPALPRDCRGHRRAAVMRILSSAQRIPPAEWPEPRRRQSTRRPPVVTQALRQACAQVAEQLGIAPAVLASRETLQTIAQAAPRSAAEIIACAHTLPWQAELLAPVVQEVLHPRSTPQ